MLFTKKTAFLALAIFLFTFSTGGSAQAQAPFKEPNAAQQSKKKWKVIDGFRSAKFGMNEKQIIQAINKDFNISKSKIKRKVPPTEKTTALIISVPDLMEVGGPADIVYILGYKSKKLMQVNIDWGSGASKNTPNHEVLDAANLLLAHFKKSKYKKDGYSVNARIDDNKILVFRGKDEKNRMVFLRLTRSKTKNVNDRKVSLVLSYILTPEKPDVFEANEK